MEVEEGGGGLSREEQVELEDFEADLLWYGESLRAHGRQRVGWRRRWRVGRRRW